MGFGCSPFDAGAGATSAADAGTTVAMAKRKYARSTGIFIISDWSLFGVDRRPSHTAKNSKTIHPRAQAEGFSHGYSGMTTDKGRYRLRVLRRPIGDPILIRRVAVLSPSVFHPCRSLAKLFCIVPAKN